MTPRTTPPAAHLETMTAPGGQTIDPLASLAAADMSTEQLMALEMELLHRLAMLRVTLGSIITELSKPANSYSTIHARSIAVEALDEDVELAEQSADRVAGERAAADPAGELRRCERFRERVLAGEWRHRRTG